MPNRMTNTGRAGFTLIEVLVTLVLVALLLGVVVPSVIGQLDRGEPTRVTADLEAVREGAKLFRIDVKRFPGTMEQLVENPDGQTWADSADINDANIPQALQNRWAGPYLEEGGIDDNVTFLPAALGSSFHPEFTSTDWSGTNFLTIRLIGLDQLTIDEIDTSIDGSVDGTTGRLRHGVVTDTLFLEYLASPIN